MKTAIRIIGYIVLTFIALGTLFKLQHYPGSSFILLLGNFIFIFGFLPIFFIQRMKNSETKIEKSSNLVGLISLMLLFLGCFFKIQHWPGASIFLIFGTFIFTFAAIPTYFIATKNKPDTKVSELGFIVILGVFISIFFSLYALNYSRDILTTYGTLGKQQTNSMYAVEDIINDYSAPTNSSYSSEYISIKKQFQDISFYIDETQKTLIQYTDRTDININEKIENPNLILYKDNIDVANVIMVGQTIGNNDNARGLILKNQISALRNSILNYLNTSPNNEQLQRKISILLNSDDVVNYNNEIIPWENEMFYYTPLIGTISILSGIKHNIKCAELLITKYEFEKNNSTKLN